MTNIFIVRLSWGKGEDYADILLRALPSKEDAEKAREEERERITRMLSLAPKVEEAINAWVKGNPPPPVLTEERETWHRNLDDVCARACTDLGFSDHNLPNVLVSPDWKLTIDEVPFG